MPHGEIQTRVLLAEISRLATLYCSVMCFSWEAPLRAPSLRTLDLVLQSSTHFR
jgi:hypothetical protein